MLLPSAEKWWDVTVNKTVKTSSIWKIRYCNTRGLTGTTSQAASGCRAGAGGCVSEEATHKAAGWPPGTDPKPPRLVGPSPAHHGFQPLSGPHGRSTVRTVSPEGQCAEICTCQATENAKCFYSATSVLVFSADSQRDRLPAMSRTKADILTSHLEVCSHIPGDSVA